MKTKMSIPQRIWAYIKGNPIVVMMAMVSLIVGCTINNFFSLNNFNVLMGNTTIRFLIALGVSGCLITKGTDLSAGRQAALAVRLHWPQPSPVSWFSVWTTPAVCSPGCLR